MYLHSCCVSTLQSSGKYELSQSPNHAFPSRTVPDDSFQIQWEIYALFTGVIALLFNVLQRNICSTSLGAFRFA